MLLGVHAVFVDVGALTFDDLADGAEVGGRPVSTGQLEQLLAGTTSCIQ